MTFLNDSIDLFSGAACSHMGPYQYDSHAGMRNGCSTSGALLWAKAEAERATATGNMVNAETNLLKTIANEISRYVPVNTPVVELGPGTITAFRNKTLSLIRVLNSPQCILVDESVAFLKQIYSATDLAGLKFKPYIDNFLRNEDVYFEERALVCSFGSTISNIINPFSQEPPEESLTESLATMARAAYDGWLLIGVDTDQDGESIKAYFGKHGLFQLNVFDRMSVELPMEGFDPTAFDYEPLWLGSSGQLAHMAVVNRNIDFSLNGQRFSLKKNAKLHIKNSYKFKPEFFEQCCTNAGLEIINTWSDDSPARVYLLKLFPQEALYLSSKNRLAMAC